MAEAAKSRSEPVAALPTWPDEIYRVLKDAGVRQVAMVPDAGHSRLIRAFEADPETRVVTLTTEEEGVAMLAGAWLGGERGVLLLQSSGVGNCINMLSLPVDLPHAAVDDRHDARRLGRVQPVADPDGAGHAAVAGGHGRDREHGGRARSRRLRRSRARRTLPSTPGSRSRS